MALKYVLMVLSCMWGCAYLTHTNFVIVGGTGDLARKYLWGSALQLFVQEYNENCTFSFYAGSRVTQDVGDKALSHILEDIKCDVNDQKCIKLRPSFIDNSKYIPLTSGDSYRELCEHFQSKYSPKNDIKQIFYLSIPSSAYESVSRSIHNYCRLDFISSTRIVLEKPFGGDKTSAKKQTDVIGQFFEDDEVRRVDHYLAKTVSKQILSFRYSFLC